MQKMERMLQNIKGGPKFLKELKEFDNLIKAIGECKSKAEEDRIIAQELEVLKQRFSDPKLDKSRGREYMVRLIYCEMLGHDASFAYVKALQFASDANIHTKKAAYLALTQLLDHNNQLVLLLVNTLLSDMKSDNFLNVCTALMVTTRLIGPDLVNAVYPVVVERLRHPKEAVRKKAVMALHWFHTLDPRRDGPLAGVDMDRHFRTMLCDKDPAVMSASLCALYDCIKADPRPYKNLIASFTSILKQVAEHRLPKTYDYHRFPAPFIQIKLLKIIAALGQGDKASSENMYAVVHATLRRANSSHTIGNALIYECVRTITTIYPNPQLLAAAAEAIASFLKSTSHNLRYVGIDALAGIVKINPAYANEHQVAVLDCLEDPDDTLKLKTLELLAKMTKSHNVEVIVDKMMGYLRTSSDEHIRKDIVRKVSDLAERYAPSPSWFIHTLSQVFLLGGEHVEPAMAHNLCRLLAEQDDADLHRSAVAAYLELLDRPKLPERLMQVICWVLGEYGHLAPLPATAVLARMAGMLNSQQKVSDCVRCYLLAGAAKLALHAGLTSLASLPPDLQDFVKRAASSQSLELQQRAHELTALLSLPPALASAVVPVDGSCEEFTEADMQQVVSLPFLGAFVTKALQGGAMPYLPPEARQGSGHVAETKGHLRFEAYEPAPAAGRAAGAGGSTASHDSYDVRGAASGAAPSYYAGQSSGPGTPAAAAASSYQQQQQSNEPQLVAAKAGGVRRWGPAQYGSEPELHEPAPAAASTSTQATGYPPRAGGHSRSGSTGVPPGMAQERERLAASLFGGGPAGPFGAPQQQPTTHARQQQPSSAPTRLPPPPQQQQQASPLDLLMDLDGPTPAPMQHSAAGGWAAATPAPAGGGGDLLGSLLGPGASNNSHAPVHGLDSLLGGGGAQQLYGGMGAVHAHVPQQYGMPAFPPQQQQPQQYGGLGGINGTGQPAMAWPGSSAAVAYPPAQGAGMQQWQAAGQQRPAPPPLGQQQQQQRDPFGDLLG